MAEGSIEIYESEDRRFPPSAAFVAQANANDRSMWDEAEADYEAFWARQARELLTWHKDFDTVLEWELPFSKWFVGGELNLSYNCLDRHVEALGGRLAQLAEIVVREGAEGATQAAVDLRLREGAGQGLEEPVAQLEYVVGEPAPEERGLDLLVL